MLDHYIFDILSYIQSYEVFVTRVLINFQIITSSCLFIYQLGIWFLNFFAYIWKCIDRTKIEFSISCSSKFWKIWLTIDMSSISSEQFFFVCMTSMNSMKRTISGIIFSKSDQCNEERWHHRDYQFVSWSETTMKKNEIRHHIGLESERVRK